MVGVSLPTAYARSPRGGPVSRPGIRSRAQRGPRPAPDAHEPAQVVRVDGAGRRVVTGDTTRDRAKTQDPIMVSAVLPEVSSSCRTTSDLREAFVEHRSQHVMGVLVKP
ncbi:hypothetical protein KNE206_24190 [Kitasatospora sp. NE20-6]